MEKYKILVAEDDENIANIIKLYLECSDFHVYLAYDGQRALEIFEAEQIQLAILDIMLPRRDGYELIKIFRQKSALPILVVSAKDQGADKILGLSMGADDYLIKPFDPLELVARVQAKLKLVERIRSVHTDKSEELCIGDICMDLKSMTVTNGGAAVELTAIEFKILAVLMRYPRQVFTRMQLYESIYGECYDGEEKTIMVHIYHIREKLGHKSDDSRYIQTVRGIGYRFEN